MKRFFVILMLLALSACGSDLTKLTIGALTVTISGLPAATNASVGVTGPNSFSQALTATTTLDNLKPGTYTITPADVVVGGSTYKATAANAVVNANATASATITYAVVPPAEVTLLYASFTGGTATTSTQDGAIISYKYAGGGASSNIDVGQPVKDTTAGTLSSSYSLGAGGFAGVALGVNGNTAGTGVDLSAYSKIRLRLARSGGGALNVKIVGDVVAVQNSGCYPSYQATTGDDSGVAVTDTLTEYTLELSKFAYRSFCSDPDRRTLAQTITNVVRIEIEDRFLPATGTQNRTMTLGEIRFVQ